MRLRGGTRVCVVVGVHGAISAQQPRMSREARSPCWFTTNENSGGLYSLSSTVPGLVGKLLTPVKGYSVVRRGPRFPRDQRGSDQTAPFPDPYVHPKEVSIASSCPLAPPRAPPMGPAIHFEAMKRRNRSPCSKKGKIRAVSEGFMKFSMSDRGSFIRE